MPRLTATRPITAPPRPAGARPAAPRRAAKKPIAVPDRLTARALFMRRVRRSLKPGLWLFAGVIAIALGSEIFRAIPPLAPVVSPAGTLRHGLAALAGFAGFRVTDIEIDGDETTKPAAIKAALGVAIGDPILGLSLAAMRARLEQLGPVQTATVERALPGTLIIDISERAATAIWQTGSGAAAQFVLIDKHGNVITNQDAVAAKRRDPSLLLLVGADAPQNAATLLTELRAEPSVMSRVVAAERVDGLRWNLILKDNATVKLPAAGEAGAIAELAALQASMALLDRPVEAIDLRLPDRLVVRPYPAAPAGKTAAGPLPAKPAANRT
jgi:cell division protein FtsQ